MEHENKKEKIVFYPRDIGMWRRRFTFTADHNTKKEFNSKTEFLDFLKENGVRLDDPKFPLQFKKTDNPKYGSVEAIIQSTTIGWIKKY
jgi:hypothetical protein